MRSRVAQRNEKSPCKGHLESTNDELMNGMKRNSGAEDRLAVGTGQEREFRSELRTDHFQYKAWSHYNYYEC
jgi:hypothetical protein